MNTRNTLLTCHQNQIRFKSPKASAIKWEHTRVGRPRASLTSAFFRINVQSSFCSIFINSLNAGEFDTRAESTCGGGNGGRGCFLWFAVSVVREKWPPADVQSTSGIGVDFCAALEVLLGLWWLGLLGLLGLLLWSHRNGLRWTCLGSGHEGSKWMVEKSKLMVKRWRSC